MKKKDRSKPYRMRYAGSNKRRGKRGGVTITLPCDPRKGICEACGKSVDKEEIKFTALHHWHYGYHPKTVKEDPMKAIENTSELCYYCHRLADGIRALLYAKPHRVAWVAACVKGEPKSKLIMVLEKSLEAITTKNIRENTNNISDEK